MLQPTLSSLLLGGNTIKTPRVAFGNSGDTQDPAPVEATEAVSDKFSRQPLTGEGAAVTDADMAAVEAILREATDPERGMHAELAEVYEELESLTADHTALAEQHRQVVDENQRLTAENGQLSRENAALTTQNGHIAEEMVVMRARAQRDKDTARQDGIRSAIKALRPALDSVARALTNLNETADPATLRTGLQLIGGQFEAALRRIGVERIPAAGGSGFDPNIHNAIGHMPSEHPVGTVAAEVQGGYTLNGKVVEPSDVMLSQGSAS